MWKSGYKERREAEGSKGEDEEAPAWVPGRWKTLEAVKRWPGFLFCRVRGGGEEIGREEANFNIGMGKREAEEAVAADYAGGVDE